MIEELKALEASRFDVSMRAVTEEGEGHKLRLIRRDIARIKTIQQETQGIAGKGEEAKP